MAPAEIDNDVAVVGENIDEQDGSSMTDKEKLCFQREKDGELD